MEIDMRDSQQPPTPHDATGKKQIRLHYIIQKYFIHGISIFFFSLPGRRGGGNPVPADVDVDIASLCVYDYIERRRRRRQRKKNENLQG